MPCGGIWTPELGSHWLDHECWVCGEKGCELFCDEWDTTLHVRCLGKFLETEEGRCMLLHGHGITIPEREDGQGWPGVKPFFEDLPRSDLRFSPEQIGQLRADVAAGAGHDCGEWVKDGKCQLCDRDMT